ncbi:MAG: rsaE [Phenylobacterium sp.]|jgi:HlyD family type I secretion membrane fusion protein|uniref:HlyD family type I secretion periplasmic adaptor subunit n=1 Tax=Phenylobacterium sp. TaxID=1871053 RepID=UPI002604CD4A|nr:HlyD family type I secretion periplasmic adaptor subunit [Phenylobacterium sp.]MDB5428196.1 rsaE [Phenylobacterium sp.]MDB5437454.1 rsaE [Phenylobacterium sp.]MDB5463525.1 rsaE [Phenylobacterium sp.]MDB5499740.1 rsaE [Phenylobacterium sp.]
MKLDLTPVRSSYVAPTFGGDELLPIDPALQRRMRRPMIVGAAIIGVLVLGLGLWASLTPLATGITASGEVRVESNKKTLRHREGGTVRQILVQEGQHVRASQPMILFNDVEARASYDVLQNQVDSLQVQAARFTAEATNRPTLEFPPEVMGRMSDPRVAGMVRDQQFLFTTRSQLFESQNSVLSQRLDQIQTQVGGQQAQVASVDEQISLTKEEMAGYQTLYDKGFAPKPLILRYQRSLADLQGRKGSLLSDIARLRQQGGETRMQVSANRDTRTSQAAEGLRDAQTKLADTLPRLAAAKEMLDATVVRAPVDGYVFNLTQFTVGGVTGPGEVLLDVVPANAPIVVTAMIEPKDIDKIREGMDAQVRFTGLNQRWHGPMKAKVVLVSADKIVNEKSGASFYRADLRIDSKELTKLKRSAQITPGMPAQVMVVTGEKTVMGSLISPITDTLHGALHD